MGYTLYADGNLIIHCLATRNQEPQGEIRCDCIWNATPTQCVLVFPILWSEISDIRARMYRSTVAGDPLYDA